MKVVPLPSDGLRVGRPLPFALRDASGLVLLARGATIETAKQLQLLQSRPLYIDLSEHEAVQRVVNGQLDQMFLQDQALGRIASAKPDYDRIPLPSARLAASPAPVDWADLQMRLRVLLGDPRAAGWVERLRQVRDEILALLARQPDRALRRLIHEAGLEFRQYSAHHSLLVCVLVTLACEQVAGWDARWLDPLTLAALSMNLSFLTTQDVLAAQPGPLSATQSTELREHPRVSAEWLAELGVTDPLWLEAVRHHHDAPAGPLAGRSPPQLLARLIRRVDRYAARLSPRRSRPASSSTVAAQGVLLDEGGHPDDAGQALVRTIGLYPPGSWVRLASGEVALVLRRTAQVNAPVVASVVGRSGLALSVPALRNPRLPAYAITGAVSASDVRVRPNLEALEKLA